MLLNPYRFGGGGGGGGFPLTLPGLKGWWDASDASTITLTSGKVSQWSDKSGAGRHASQATESLMPVVSAAAWNGLDILQFTAGRMPWTSMSFTDSAFYFFAVASTTSNSIVIGAASNYPLWILGEEIYSNLAGSDQSIAAPGANDGDPHIVGRNGSATSADAKLWYDGTGTTKGASSASISGFGTYSGGLYANGAIAEVVIGDADLDPTQLAALHAYLKAKWGTP